MAISRATVALHIATQCLTPTISATLCSNSRTSGPSLVSQRRSSTSRARSRKARRSPTLGLPRATVQGMQARPQPERVESCGNRVRAASSRSAFGDNQSIHPISRQFMRLVGYLDHHFPFTANGFNFLGLPPAAQAVVDVPRSLHILPVSRCTLRGVIEIPFQVGVWNVREQEVEAATPGMVEQVAQDAIQVRRLKVSESIVHQDLVGANTLSEQG